MILRPDQVGWDELPPDVDPRVYRRVLLTPAGTRHVEVPDGVTRIEWRHGGPVEWPAESSVNDVAVIGVFERVVDIVGFWRGLYGALAHGGYARIYAPYWSHIDVASDPTRLRGLSERHLGYLSASGRLHLREDPYEDGLALRAFAGIDLDTIRLGQMAEPEWEGRAESDCQRAVAHLLNTVRRVEATLQCYKPSRAASDV